MKKISEDSEETYKTPQVLIDQLLELYFTGKLDEKIIGDQVETIVVAGNETTALSLAYITLLLAMYPNIQEKVFEELRSVFETQDEEMSYEHIQKLPYLDRVIKEGMRVLPVVPFMMRTATADTQISNCVIPKEAFILMSIFNLHRVSLTEFDEKTNKKTSDMTLIFHILIFLLYSNLFNLVFLPLIFFNLNFCSIRILLKPYSLSFYRNKTESGYLGRRRRRVQPRSFLA